MFKFPREKRLLKKSEFDLVFNKGKKIVSKDFIFFYIENNLTYARLGLAISKKRMSKAHDRQRVKRLIRETFRCCKLIHLDVVVIARQAVDKELNVSLNTQLRQVWDSFLKA